MKLESSYDVPAPRSKVWDAFLDPTQLKQAIPGCEKLEAVGPDEYKATMKIGVGGVKGTFEGKVRITDKKPPESYKMAVEGSGGPGFIRGETVITLTDAEGGTRVSYSADVQVGGLIASVGQRMLGGVSKMMADKFFNRMAELLQGWSRDTRLQGRRPRSHTLGAGCRCFAIACAPSCSGPTAVVRRTGDLPGR
jgi:uncharacterized protein